MDLFRIALTADTFTGILALGASRDLTAACRQRQKPALVGMDNLEVPCKRHFKQYEVYQWRAFSVEGYL
jgi:hypothetical protein